MAPESRAARRAEISEAVTRETGIDEAMIERLVHDFYGRVRQDEMLAPVFNARISDWGPHLARMCAFWSSVVLMSGAYHGQPMAKHAPLPVSGAHFDRWLALFAEAAADVCTPQAAAYFVSRAERIAESLELGIAGARGLMLRSGERLQPVAEVATAQS
jgi:hemoglobin